VPASAEDLRSNPATETMLHMELSCCARHYLFIAGFVLFLCLVVRRLVMLLVSSLAHANTE